MEIAIISGKGGTGKSSITAAFATLAKSLVLADCDVDAANLFILFQPLHESEEVFTGSEKARIDPKRCTNCGLCIEYCRFNAIYASPQGVSISETLCDGCHLCRRICPQSAINMVENNKSRLYTGSFRHGRMVYGRLAPGEENSGKLVNLVREKARNQKKAHGLSTILIDGPPGIGCPVISTINGVDQVIIVTEPGLSGLHDLQRAAALSTGFAIKTRVIINKYDLDITMSEQTALWCRDHNLELLARIPFDQNMVEAMVNCKSLPEWAPGSEASICLQEAWHRIISKHKEQANKKNPLTKSKQK